MSEIRLKFPDGSGKTFEKGVTPAEVVKTIGPRLAKEALVARVDGRLVDLSAKLENDTSIEYLTIDSEEGRDVFRHSSSHLMACAVQDLFPGTKFGIGPAIEDGYYYDFDRPDGFTEEDLRALEKKMKELAG